MKSSKVAAPVENPEDQPAQKAAEKQAEKDRIAETQGLLQSGTHYEGSFLQLLNGDVGRRQPRSKEVRRRGERERMRKIFPADFFGN